MPLPFPPSTAGTPTTGTLATVADLATYTGQTLADDDPKALLALRMATGILQAETSQHLLAVTGDVVMLSGGQSVLTLPERPVTAVTAVTSTYGGLATTYPTTQYERRADSLWFGLGGLGWAAWPSLVTVTYDHGYSTTPADLQAVCLALAGRILQSPTDGVIGETQGQWSTQWDRGATGPVLLDAERSVVRRYRRAAYSLSVA